jgi:hypothetical protein
MTLCRRYYFIFAGFILPITAILFSLMIAPLAITPPPRQLLRLPAPLAIIFALSITLHFRCRLFMMIFSFDEPPLFH